MIEGLRPLERAQPNARTYGDGRARTYEGPVGPVIVADQIFDDIGGTVPMTVSQAPPFEVCTIETAAAAFIASTHKVYEDAGAPGDWGSEGEHVGFDVLIYILNDQDGPESLPFWEDIGVVRLDKLGFGDGRVYYDPPDYSSLDGPEYSHIEIPSPEEVGMVVASWAGIVMAVFRFMHLKNVELMDATDERPRRVRRRAQKRGIEYKVLAVRRKRKLYPVTGLPAHGEQKRLHLVRGHIKTYTPEAPGMGHLVGSYYWGPHLRGDIEAGEIVKDYELQT